MRLFVNVAISLFNELFTSAEKLITFALSTFIFPEKLASSVLNPLETLSKLAFRLPEVDTTLLATVIIAALRLPETDVKFVATVTTAALSTPETDVRSVVSVAI